MYFDKLNTIVIKIGSSLIIDEKKKIRSKWLDSFVKDIQGFKKAGKRTTWLRKNVSKLFFQNRTRKSRLSKSEL